MNHMGRVAIALVFATMAATAAPAAAHDEDFESKVTLRQIDGANFKGRVTSDLKGCYQERKVVMYTAGGQKVDSEFTDAEGKYRFEFIGQSYYARVKEVEIMGGSHGHTCLADKSKTTEPPERMRGGERVATKITINDSCSFDCRAASHRNYTAEFFGKVKSEAAVCERRRQVRLFRRAASGPGYELIGETESDGDGNWGMTRTDKPGFTKYLVKTSAVEKGNKLCERATSDKESHDPF